MSWTMAGDPVDDSGEAEGLDVDNYSLAEVDSPDISAEQLEDFREFMEDGSASSQIDQEPNPSINDFKTKFFW